MSSGTDLDENVNLFRFLGSKEHIKAYIQSQLNAARCVNCQATFIPAHEIGMRYCRIHPRPTTGQSVTPDQYLTYGGDSRSEVEHYTCCGELASRLTHVNDYYHGGVHGTTGCTKADHWAEAERWGYLYPGEVREEVTAAFEMSFGWSPSQYYASQWLCVIPTFLLPLIGRDIEDTIRITNAVECNNLSDIVNERREGRIAVVNAGTHRIKVDLKKAYVHMTSKFALPCDIVSNTTSLVQGQGAGSGGSAITSSSSFRKTMELALPQNSRGRETVPSASSPALHILSSSIFGRAFAAVASPPHNQPIRSGVLVPTTLGQPIRRAKFLHSPADIWEEAEKILKPMFLKPRDAFFPFIVFSWMEGEPSVPRDLVDRTRPCERHRLREGTIPFDKTPINFL